MVTLTVSEETAKFLKELGKEIANQNNHGTSDPYYFTVQCDRLVAVPEGTTEDVRYFLEDCSYTEEQLMAYCKENEMDFEETKSGATKYDVDTVSENVNVFLTLKGYEEHMKLNGHNYRHYKEYRSYLQHAFRNPEMEGLIKALREIYLACSPS